MLTPDEVAIKERCENATVGPWESWCRDVGNPNGDPVWDENHFLQFEIKGPRPVYGRGDFVGRDSDFIAHARTDIPTLLATIEELRETIAILGRSVNSTADMVTERNAKIAALHEALAQARNALESGV
jgi:hypothetical protein